VAVGSSKPLSVRDLPGILAREPLPRVFVLLGEEQELKDEATAELARTLSRRTEPSFEQHRLDCEEESLSSLAATHLVGSLFATSKLVLFSRFEKAPIAQRRALLTELSAGGHHPSLTVVIHSTERNLPSGVDGKGLTTFMFWPLNQPYEVENWIKGVLKKLGQAAEKDFPANVYRKYGNDLGFIRREIEKAHLIAGGKTLTLELFERVAVSPPGQELFAVLDALVAGRSRQALAGLRDLWTRGEPPQKVLPLLLIQYHRLLHASALHEAEPGRFAKVVALVDKHRSTPGFFQQKAVEKELAAAFHEAVEGTPFSEELLALKPMAVLALASQLVKTNARSVRELFRDLLVVDFKMKTSSMAPELALEMIAARPPVSAAK
jgi:DNA polymerase III delta subunit